MKKKHELLEIVRNLTDGVVGQTVSWSTVKGPSKENSDPILRKQSREIECTDSAACKPVVYSLHESCELLQSSYDDLYDDDGIETSSVETETSTNHDDALLNDDNGDNKTDSVDGPLNGSFSSSSDCKERSAKFTAHSGGDFGEPLKMEDASALYTPDVWQSYYARLEKIGHAMKDREGWPNFDAVFMISALNSDGVVDIKVNRFLLPCTGCAKK